MDSKNKKKLAKVNDTLADQQVEVVKSIVQDTLQEIDDLEKKRQEIQESIRTLKLDIVDFKEGRLDRVIERHVVSPESKEISFCNVVRDKENDRPSSSHWYEAYLLAEDISVRPISINNSTAKQHATGSYKLKNGDVRYVS